MLDDSRVNAIGLHIEGISDIESFDIAAKRALKMKVPIITIKSGKTKGSIKPKYGKPYLEFIKRYIVCVPVIQGYVHTLVKLLYRLKHDQGRVRRS